MKKITTNAESVRVVGNLIPNFDEVTTDNYFFYRNVTHTQQGTVRHLGDDRLVRKVIASKISTTLYIEVGTPDENNEANIYVKLTANDGSWLPEHLVASIYYEDDTYIGLINLEPMGGEEDHYNEGLDRFVINRTGNVTIKAIFRGYGHYTSSEATVTVNISSYTSIDCTTTDAWARKNDQGATASAELDNNGYITSNHGNNNYHTYCTALTFQKGMTIEADMLLTNGAIRSYGPNQILVNFPTRYTTYGQYSVNMEESHSGSRQTDRRITPLSTNTLINMTWVIDSDGYITYSDSIGNNLKSAVAFTDSELAVMVFAFCQWNSHKTFSLHRLEYKID